VPNDTEPQRAVTWKAVNPLIYCKVVDLKATGTANCETFVLANSLTFGLMQTLPSRRWVNGPRLPQTVCIVRLDVVVIGSRTMA